MVSTAGCGAEGIFHITINKNGSADLNYKVGIDNTIYSMMIASNNDPLADFKKETQSEGFTVANFNDGQMSGVITTKHVNSSSELAGTANFFNGQNMSNFLNGQNNITKSNNPLTVTRSFFSTQYNLNTNIDLSSMEGNSKDQFSGLGNAMLSQIKLQLLLTLPIKPGINNAINVSDNGRTLEWDLIPGQNNHVQMAATAPNVLNIALTAVGAAIIIAALVVFLILHKRKKLTLQSQQNITID
ncbi:MAG: DUF3153 domain-containing protein [Thermacetogeniaceae bacterium]|jgi:hypothetical protein